MVKYLLLHFYVPGTSSTVLLACPLRYRLIVASGLDLSLLTLHSEGACYYMNPTLRLANDANLRMTLSCPILAAIYWRTLSPDLNVHSPTNKHAGPNDVSSSKLIRRKHSPRSWNH
ncbi:hypothetical protein NPIL_613831 [Nephila pilipes]|uniref:Secreted protein n=1 Tax=Nephila pilipes TaxID=299642 RepID=A0A8X6U759_NEPPI|nr:hypothetical protein NPIL_613831 [Nephila pilipes]